MDCMELLKDTPDKYYDLAIVDPPYRDSNQPTKDMRKNGQMKSIQGIPSKKYFLDLCRVSKNQIIWGANNFQLPQFMGFVVWEKITISENFTMSMAEIASLSSGISTVSKIFKFAPQGSKIDPRIHPTQKPVALYKWLLHNYAQQGDKILDTHAGSFSIGIACDDMGFDLTATELDKEYFESAVKRFKVYKSQGKLDL